MALLKTNTGIGTTNPTSALHVIGDVLVTGVVTSTTFNGNINSGIGTIVNLTNTRLTSGVGTITTFNSNTATILDIDNLRMLSGIATITQINATTIVSTNNDLDHLNANFGNIDVGIVTNISGTYLNYTGVGTIATLNSNETNLTNLNVSGISTLADIRAQRVTVTGIVTANSFRPTSGYIQAADGTNSFYIYNTTGNVAFQGTIGVNQINNASGFQVLTFNNLDTRLTGNLDIAGVTTSSVFNGNIYSLGVSTFRNGPVLIGTGTSTGTAFQPLQVTGGAYISNSLGIGTITPGSNLDVIGNAYISGIITATNLDVTREVVGTSTITDLYASNGYINVGVVTDLTNTRFTSGISSITDLYASNGYVNVGVVTDLTNTRFTSGISSITDLYASNGYINVGVVTDLTNTRFISGISTITDLYASNGYINVGVVTDLTNTRLTSGIATITTLDSSTGIINNLTNNLLNTGIGSVSTLYSSNAYINSGIVTDISGTRLNYTGVGTIATLDSSTGTINNLTNNLLNTGIGSIATFYSSNSYINVGVVTDLTNTRLTSGIATITTLDGTHVNLTDLNVSGISTQNIVRASTLDVSGVGTIATINSTNIVSTNSDFINLNADNGYIVTGIITDISNSRLTSGIATITSLDATTGSITTLSGTNVTYTNSDFVNLNADNANIDVGIVTAITGAYLNYTGVGTITTLDSDTASINNLTSDYINVGVATANTLNSGIGTITNLNNTFVNVSGVATITTLNSTNLTSTNSDFTNLNANSAYIDVGIVTDISGAYLNYTGIGTIATLDTTNGAIDYLTNTDLTVTGIATIQNLDVLGDFDVFDSTATFHNNVFIAGNLSIGGTTSVITAADLRVIDKEIILGITTDAFNNDVSTDITASHGGIAIASTEGYPLVNLALAGFSSLPATYKQLMWVAKNSYGVGTTDAWMFNYAVGIGSTLIPNDVRLAVGNVQITDKQINADTLEVSRLISGIATVVGADIGNLNSNNIFSQSGIITDLSGTRLNYTGFGTITNLYSDIAYVDNISSNVGFATAFTGERLNIIGIGTIVTFNSTTSTITNLNVTNSSFSNVNVNNLYAVTGIVTTLTSNHSTLENINSSGISTLNIVRTNTINSSGVVTAPTFVGDLLGVANYAHVAGFSTFSGYANASGVSTFSGYADSAGVSTFSGYADVAGVSTFSGYANNAGIATYAWTAGVSTYSGVSGYSTFSGYSDTSGFSTFSGYSNISGFSTFTDYANNAGISTYAWTAGVSTYSGIAGYSTFSGYSDTSGVSTFSGYANASGVSTFSGYSDTSGVSTFSGYANASGVSTFSGYANNAGIATYAWTAGVSTYSGVAGVSTSVDGGNANVSQLVVTGVSTLGFATVSSVYVVGFTTIGQVQINPSGIITSSSPGITTVKYYGDGSNLIGVNAFNVISQPLSTAPVYPTFASNVGVTSIGISSTQIAYIPSSNYFGIGTTTPEYNLEIVGNARVSGVTSVTNLQIYSNVSAGNTTGNDGQYLRSTGIGVTWDSFPTLRTTGITTAIYGQTVFNFTYNVGFLDVYVNGVKLTSSEYVASNGANVTLVSPTFANDIVEFVSYNTLSTGSGGGGGGGSISLDNLTDVIITNPQAGELLGFDGTYWINDYTFTTTTATVSQVPIHTISSTDYRSIEYMIQVTNGVNYHLTKVLVLHDGTTAYNTEYGTISTGPALATFDTDISGGAIRLLATPYSSSTMTYKIKFTAIKA